MHDQNKFPKKKILKPNTSQFTIDFKVAIIVFGLNPSSLTQGKKFLLKS
jgi:hypothetical protein